MSYRILKHLGEGGQGSVYVAEGVVGKVALKEVEGEDAATFEASRLKGAPAHPNLVEFRDVVREEDVENPHGVRTVAPDWRTEIDEADGGSWFIVMSYLEGTTLTEYPQFQGLSPIGWWQLLSQILDGVDHMHRHDLIHRDLKPDNIIIVKANGKPRPVVVDVGLAKRRHSDRTKLHGYTPKYAPPEYQDRDLILPPYDIYQLALISFEAMYGDDYYDPDEGWDTKEVRRCLLEESPSPFTCALADGLADSPLDRPQSISEWIKAMVGLVPLPEVDSEKFWVGSTSSSGARVLDAQAMEAGETDRAEGTNRGFKESTAKVSVKALRDEIEKEFGLPQGSVVLLRPSGDVAHGGMHLGKLTDELWEPSGWDYGEATLARLAQDVAARFGLKEKCIAFRNAKGERYGRRNHVRSLRQEYET